jgi:hypothetical protein
VILGVQVVQVGLEGLEDLGILHWEGILVLDLPVLGLLHLLLHYLHYLPLLYPLWDLHCSHLLASHLCSLLDCKVEKMVGP